MTSGNKRPTAPAKVISKAIKAALIVVCGLVVITYVLPQQKPQPPVPDSNLPDFLKLKVASFSKVEIPSNAVSLVKPGKTTQDQSSFSSGSASSSTCLDESIVYDENVFESLPVGDDWSLALLKAAEKDVASQSAPLHCDLSKLDDPIHIVTVTSNDTKYRVALHSPNTDTFISEPMREYGVPFEFKFHSIFRAGMSVIAKHIKSDDGKLLIVEAGANIGSHALFFASLNHETHAFEPFPKNMRLLRCSSQINRFKILFLNRIALSNETSSNKCINSPNGNQGGSTVSDTCFTEKDVYQSSMGIKTIPLDSYWDVVLKRRRVHMMKVDVEGYEVKLFLGSTKMLQTSPPYIIYSELLTRTLTPLGFQPIDFINLMESFGYVTYSGNTLEVYDKEVMRDDDLIIFFNMDILKKKVQNLKGFFGVRNTLEGWVIE
ncbi:hypothetical protein HDU76_006030 [Blyttiomyces sp. JEL0837]|nr:hypothetical protein HDU76_006030 [Blyttiomyces sp. JEL0837]